MNSGVSGFERSVGLGRQRGALEVVLADFAKRQCHTESEHGWFRQH